MKSSTLIAVAVIVALASLAVWSAAALGLPITINDPKYLISDPDMNENGWMTWAQMDYSTPANPDPPSQIMLYNGSDTIVLGVGREPHINARGWVAWVSAAPESNKQAMLYKAGETMQLSHTTGPYNNGDIVMNSKGWVSWANGGDIYLYDGSKTIKLPVEEAFSQNAYNSQPLLNEKGQLAWTGEEDRGDGTGAWDDRVYFFDGSKILNLHKGNAPSLDNSGRILFCNWDGDDPDVFLFDGANITQLTRNDTPDVPVQINNGWMLWESLRDPAKAEDDEYVLSNGGEQIRFQARVDFGVSLNSLGWVTWVGWDGHDYEIFLFDQKEIIQLTDNEENDYFPQINSIPWAQSWANAGISTAAATGKGTAKMATVLSEAKLKPRAFIKAPKISALTSKNRAFKIRWTGYNPRVTWQANGGINRVGSGLSDYTVQYKAAGASTWSDLKTKTTATSSYFTGRPGQTYSFRALVKDTAGNIGWSPRVKTVVPLDEGQKLIKKRGFRRYVKPATSFYLGSVRYSKTRGDALVYKLTDTNSISLLTTRGPDRGRAKIFIDGKYKGTVDAYAPTRKFRQRLFYQGFRMRGTHYLRIVNAATPGRPRFDVDGIVAAK